MDKQTANTNRCDFCGLPYADETGVCVVGKGCRAVHCEFCDEPKDYFNGELTLLGGFLGGAYLGCEECHNG